MTKVEQAVELMVNEAYERKERFPKKSFASRLYRVQQEVSLLLMTEYEKGSIEERRKYHGR